MTRGSRALWAAIAVLCIGTLVLPRAVARGDAALDRERAAAPVSPVDRYAPPVLRAASAALLDVTTGRWLLLRNADVPRAMASTTKIMTALVALTYGRLDDLVPVDAGAVAVGQESGSNMGLVAGEQVPLRDLLYGLLLPSGNDAALAIAAHVGGSVPAFVDLMNRAAARLALRHTHYVNPHGLDAPGQYTSARDLVLLAQRAMQIPFFRQIVATPSYVIPATATHGAHALSNINLFLDWYPGADGVKPGFTGNAGLCQVLSARRGGHWLIGALMNTPDLHTDARALMNYGFGDFRWTPSGQPGDTPEATVAGGAPDDPVLYFPATGHRLRAGFLAYYLRHGGAAVLGLPRTDEFVEGGLTVQYFDRARLWWDAAAGVAMATPLGQEALARASAPDTARARQIMRPVVPPTTDTAVSGSATDGATATRLYITVTGHVVQGAILRAYQAWGGTSTFGYPLSEELQVDGATVQYFSNAVFRWTPDGGVSLAPLGDEALRWHGDLRGTQLWPDGV